jgi:hypothetical protein
LALGTASTRVVKCAKTQDGALAWKSLKDFHDNEGNKDLYKQTCLTDLPHIKYEYNSIGGFNKYVNDLEQVIKQINDTAQTELDDSLKKTIILSGIHD